MAQNCPAECPNVQICEARIDGIQNRVISLLEEQSILTANLASLEAADNNTVVYGGRTYVFPPNINVLTRDWTEDVSDDIRINSGRLVRAQEAAPAVRAAHETCQAGPVPTSLGQLAILRARAKRFGKELSEPERAAVLAEDSRYLRCGNKAAIAALRDVPSAY